jgi:hypothetical protein
LLIGGALALSRLRYRGDELRRAAALYEPLRRLSLLVELPVTFRVFIRGVENRMLEEWIICNYGPPLNDIFFLTSPL